MSQRVHIGFYNSDEAPIGRFQTLLYVPVVEQEEMVEFIRQYFAGLPGGPTEAGMVSAGLLMGLGRHGVQGVKMVDRLNPNIDLFFKVVLGSEPRMEGFLVSPSSEVADPAEAWVASRQPDGWVRIAVRL